TFMTNIARDPSIRAAKVPGEFGSLEHLGFNVTMRPPDPKWMGPDVGRRLRPIVDFIAKANLWTEAYPKFLAYQWALDLGLGPRQAAYVARTYSGTPKFKRGGYRVREMNTFAMYSNVAIQGYRADLEIATGNGVLPSTAH